MENENLKVLSKMGTILSKVGFTSGSARSNGNSSGAVSAETRQRVTEFIEQDYIASLYTSLPRLNSLLPLIPVEEDMFQVHYENGFNLLQKCVAENNVEAVNLLLTRNPDLNRGPCSLPLHIACLKGYSDCVEDLIRHGARVDAEARMCWPGPHCEDCPGVKDESKRFSRETDAAQRSLVRREGRDKIQNAFYYAIDGKQARVLDYLLGLEATETLPISEFRRMLQVASRKRAWSCCNLLLESRADQLDSQTFRDTQRKNIPQPPTEKYLGMSLDRRLNLRTHIAAKRAPAQLILNKLCWLPGSRSELHLSKEALVYKAIIKPTWTGFFDRETETAAEMTLFHVLFFMVRKSAKLTLKVCRSFLSGDLISQVDVEDYLGKTPLHSLIIRYAFEESRRLWFRDYEPWTQGEMVELVKLFLEHGTVESLNRPGNSILTFIVRYIKDWEFIYDLLGIILEIGASPVVKDRYGHCPLTACIFKLFNDDIYAMADARTKEFFLHSLRLLCLAGADPNTDVQSLLYPLHVLLFTVSENFSSTTDKEMCENFDFIKDTLALLLQFGLDANVMTTDRAPSVYQGILKLIKISNYAIDMDKVYELVLVLLQYGLNPNLQVLFPDMGPSFYGRRNPFAVAEYYHLLGYIFVALAEKGDILNQSRDSFTRILYLLYYAMNHYELYKCLNFLSIQFPAAQLDRPCEVLHETVTDMLSEPRSLQHSARVVINRSLGGKPGLYANQLPLPKKLQNYLINYDP